MKARPDDMTVEFEGGGVEIRGAAWGDMHVAQYTLAPGTDLTPFFAALPDGLCSGNHWGTVVEGDIRVRYADGAEESTHAGEHFFWPAGHTAWTDGGVVFVAVTPLHEVRDMEEQMANASG